MMIWRDLLEDFVMLYYPTFREGLEEALEDLAAGQVISLDEWIALTP